MIANNSQVLTEAPKALYQLNADEIMWQCCRAREDFILHESAMKRQNQELNAQVDTLTAEKETIAIENRKLKTEKEAWNTEREQLLAKLAEYEARSSKE